MLKLAIGSLLIVADELAISAPWLTASLPVLVKRLDAMAPDLVAKKVF